MLSRLIPVAALLLVGWVLIAEARSPSEPRPTSAANHDPRSQEPKGWATAAPAPSAADRSDPGRSGRAPTSSRPRRAQPRRASRSIGAPTAGRLQGGVALPASGPDHVTWHPIRKRRPNPRWRRNATDRLVRLVLRIAHEHRRAHPGAPRLLIGDLSRPSGGDFGAEISGGLGHASHQNGLDADIYYPRKDRRLRAPRQPADVDRKLAQDLVNRFVTAGAQFVFTGPNLGLAGPSEVVQALPHHDDHLHVRLPG